MDAAGRPLGHPYGMPVVPAANMALYPTLGQQFRPSAGQVQYGLPPPFPFHPPSYLSPTPPVHLPPVPAPAPAPGKGFISSLETTPSPVPPPLDFELENRIEKLVEYVAKNGPQFETLMKEKQIGNPAYAFLFGAEGHSYYRHRLWLHVNGHVNSSSAPQAAASLPTLNSYTPPPLHAGLRGPSPVSVSALNPQTMPPLNLASANTPAPLTSFPLRLENARPQHLPLQQMQPVSSSFEQPQTDTGDGASKDESEPFRGLGGPLPPDVAAELEEVLVGLTGTKESIKGAKTWFMQRSIFSPALAEALYEYVLSTENAERQLHVIYLINDILFSSLQKRTDVKELDNEAHAFKPFLGAMLGAIYHNAANVEANRDRLVKILGFWAAKEVYDASSINILEGEMIAGPPRKQSSSLQSPLGLHASGLLGSTTLASLNQMPVHPGQWQPDRLFQGLEQQKLDQLKPSYLSASVDPQFLGANTDLHVPASQPLAGASSVSTLYSSLSSFLPPISTSTTVTQSVSQAAPTITLDKSPYPHFPPGLIPGMVRKIQVGSGVPYSPVSPLDIPTSIPPSTVTESYILDRVAKFFRAIGEVDPLEGQQRASFEGKDKEEVEEFGRRGGACVPPPASILLNLAAGNDSNDDMKGLRSQNSRFGIMDYENLKHSEEISNILRRQLGTLYHPSTR